ncbi:alkene reductase [Pseudoalteromonas denitrificans]|uniref:2,4-dienoyl-CoA reductase n=1 Tax=Pseudoalteromonas denitrificans DSM 6059 TaxID=1123010 RepID=A0A1I1NAM2_9GAMM|nr:alkene reductase [Pseudoalteromonas denitrificans]SFC94784.1 2,4-dienoyl-CoA reductase [Pseudoalteromonas denitrificans DSM 6059]
MRHENLFTPVDLGAGLILNNRLIMAPLTRCMADENLVPTETMAAYYGRRADIGLIISEATNISPSAQGYPKSPGLYNDAQVKAWKNITQRVHQNGGKIFVQLWHTGRVSHSFFQNGEKPLAPSAIGIEGHVPRMRELEYGEPKAMTEADITQVINDFAIAAANAKKAGFDGVEIHGANGYLIDQFLHFSSNQRTDEFGGTAKNMSRLLFSVIDAVKKEIEHVGVRLSPAAYFNMEHDVRDVGVFDYVLSKLNSLELTYVHTGIFEDSHIDYLNGSVTQYIRQSYHGTVIANGGYTAKSGAQTILKGDADLIAIGRPLIANPDYVEKVKTEQVLTEYTEDMLTELI